jgi:hypothetical protein
MFCAVSVISRWLLGNINNLLLLLLLFSFFLFNTLLLLLHAIHLSVRACYEILAVASSLIMKI